jgi:hypothetical protein
MSDSSKICHSRGELAASCGLGTQGKVPTLSPIDWFHANTFLRYQAIECSFPATAFLHFTPQLRKSSTRSRQRGNRDRSSDRANPGPAYPVRHDPPHGMCTSMSKQKYDWLRTKSVLCFLPYKRSHLSMTLMKNQRSPSTAVTPQHGNDAAELLKDQENGMTSLRSCPTPVM